VSSSPYKGGIAEHSHKHQRTVAEGLKEIYGSEQKLMNPVDDLKPTNTRNTTKCNYQRGGATEAWAGRLCPDGR